MRHLFPTPVCCGAETPAPARCTRLAAAAAAALVLAAWAVNTAGPRPALLLPLYLAVVTVPLSVWDLARHRLPDPLVLPGYPVAAVEVLWLGLAGEPAWPAILAGAGWFLLFFLLCAAGGMGMGDVKLAGLAGAALGAVSAQAALLGLMLGFILGGVAGLALVLSPASRREGVPFGPYLLLGMWTALGFA